MMFDRLFVEDDIEEKDSLIHDMSSFLTKSRIVIAEHFFSNHHKKREDHLHLEFKRSVDELQEKSNVWNEDIAQFNQAYEIICQQSNVYEQQLQWIHQEIENDEKNYPVDIINIQPFHCNPMVLLDTYSHLSRQYPIIKSDICQTKTAHEISTIMHEFESHHAHVKMFVQEHFPRILNEFETLIAQNHSIIEKMMAHEKRRFTK